MGESRCEDILQDILDGVPPTGVPQSRNEALLLAIATKAREVATKVEAIPAPIKNNLTATTAPTATDDKDKGYVAGSTWIYNGVTYTCTGNTPKAAVWVSTTDMYYFDTWSALQSVINVAGTQYVGKFANVANANGAPSGEYQSPGTIVNPIFDGGNAVFKIIFQGAISFKVVCQPRTVTNPIITKIYLTAVAKPTVPGYYIFSVIPAGGMPGGAAINDILSFDGTNWSVDQTYSMATAVLVAGTTTDTHITWRKFNGRWMSTADDYITDGKEYQTGKLWNGKPVYRRCKSGNTNTVAGDTNTGVALTGATAIFQAGCSISRNDGLMCAINYCTEVQVFIRSGNLIVWINNQNNAELMFCNRPYLAWVEYIK